MRPIFDDRLQWPIVTTLLHCYSGPFWLQELHWSIFRRVPHYKLQCGPFLTRVTPLHCGYSGPFSISVSMVAYCIVATVPHCYSSPFFTSVTTAAIVLPCYTASRSTVLRWPIFYFSDYSGPLCCRPVHPNQPFSHPTTQWSRRKDMNLSQHQQTENQDQSQKFTSLIPNVEI